MTCYAFFFNHGLSTLQSGLNQELITEVYNEMVDFWGSLYEFVMYQVKGNPAEEPVNRSALLVYIKSMVLLDVDASW